MRHLIVAALVVAAVAAVLPAALGLYLQHRQEQLLSDFAAHGLRIHAAEYDRGWMRSKTRVELVGIRDADGDAVGDAQPVRLRLTLELAHGPQVWLRAWPPPLALARGRLRVLDGPRPLPPLVLAARLGMDGELAVDGRVPDVTYSGEAGRLHSVGAEVRLVLPPDGRWRADGVLGALAATSPEGRRLRLGDLRWRLRSALPGVALPVDRVQLSLDSLQLDGTDERPALELAGLGLRLTAEAGSDTLALGTSARVETLALAGAAYAPSRLALDVAGLSRDALRRLGAGLERLDHAALTVSQQGLVTGRLLVAALPELFAGTPAATLRTLRVMTPFGEVRAEARLRLAASGEASERAPTARLAPAETLRSWGRRLRGDAKLSAPRALVVALAARQQSERAQRELALRGEPSDALPPALAADVEAAAEAATAKLVREGWLSADGARLHTELRFDASGMTVNDKPTAKPAWLAGGGQHAAP